MTINLTLKTLSTLDILRRFTYHKLALGISSDVSVWANCFPALRMTLHSKENLRDVSMS